MVASRARQLIAAAETAATVTAVTPDLPAPSSERVARELAPLRSDPPRLREVWTEAPPLLPNGNASAAPSARCLQM